MPPIESRELLEHAGWVRSLARRLVRDENLADDVAQEVLSTAIRHPPRTRANLRGWLAVSLRNALHSTSRSTRRRARREREVSRRERVPATLDLVERLDVHRKLVDEVQRLAEPYRTVILLRYFEGRSLAEIARLCVVPVPTVNSRVRRALDHLRARLDEVHGSRGAWTGMLVSFLSGLRESSVGAGGAVKHVAVSRVRRGASTHATKSLSRVVGLTAVATIVVCVAIFMERRTTSRVPDAAERRAFANAPQVAGTTPPAIEAAESRVPDRTMGLPATAGARDRDDRTAVSAPMMIQGRVVDVSGASVAGVDVGFVAIRSADCYPNAGVGESIRVDDRETESAAARRGRVLTRSTSDALGQFGLESPIADGRIIVLDPELATVLAGVAYDGLHSERVVVVSPARTLSGRVSDENGVALVDVHVSVRLPDTLRGGVGVPLDDSVTMSWVTRTDADGEFRIDHAPTLPGTEIIVAAIGCEPWQASLEVADPAPYFTVTLATDAPRDPAIRGVVETPDGAPVAGALVLCSGRRTYTNDRGEFALPDAEPVTARRLRVLRHGFAPFAIERCARETWPDPLRITLDGEPATLRGRVVHADGRPAVGAWVWLADPTIERVEDGGRIAVEALLAGEEATRFRWSLTTTDERGCFRIMGLLERSYRLRASLGNSVSIAEHGPVRSDATDVEITLPSDRDVRPPLDGVVVDRLGMPLAGVTVSTSSVALEAGDREAGGRAMRWYANGPSTRTGADGRFRLEGVPIGAESLRFQGGGVVPMSLSFDGLDSGDPEIPVDDPGPRVIVLSRLCHLRVVAHADADPGLVFELRDASDTVVPLQWKLGIGAKSLRECSLSRGRSPVLGAPDHACEIIFRIGDTIVERRAIELVPGEVAVEHYRGP